MAKNNNLVPKPSSGGALPKLIGAVFVIALLAIIVKHPGDAAEWAKSLVSGGVAVIDGFATFIRQVAN